MLIKPLLILIVLAGVSFGAYTYVNKNNPGAVLGTTNEIKSFIEEKLPQSKQMFDKIVTSESNEDSSSSEPLIETEDTSIEDLKAQNSFLNDSLELTKEQLKTLTQKSNEVKDHLVKLSGEIKESEDGSALHEKAFEYGQYIYCQEIVKEYETE